MSMPLQRIAFRSRLRGLPLLALLVMNGCGPSSAVVTGQVMYKDQTLTSGTVTFFASDGSQKSGTIGVNGTYTIYGIGVGLVRIAIFDHPRVPPGLSKALKNAPDSKLGTQERLFAQKYVALPARYRSPDKSLLTYTVKKGSQTFDITLDP